jgi:hypothetical protein
MNSSLVAGAAHTAPILNLIAPASLTLLPPYERVREAAPTHDRRRHARATGKPASEQLLC